MARKKALTSKMDDSEVKTVSASSSPTLGSRLSIIGNKLKALGKSIVEDMARLILFVDSLPAPIRIIIYVGLSRFAANLSLRVLMISNDPTLLDLLTLVSNLILWASQQFAAKKADTKINGK